VQFVACLVGSFDVVNNVDVCVVYVHHCLYVVGGFCFALLAVCPCNAVVLLHMPMTNRPVVKLLCRNPHPVQQNARPESLSGCRSSNEALHSSVTGRGGLVDAWRVAKQGDQHYLS